MTDRNILLQNLNCYFDNFWIDKEIDLERNFRYIPTNKFNACMMYIYDCYIKTLETLGSQGNRIYNAIDFKNIIDWYISKALDYDFISLYGFSLLINRSKVFLDSLKNSIEPEKTIDSFSIEPDDIIYLANNNLLNIDYISCTNNSKDLEKSILLDSNLEHYSAVNCKEDMINKFKDNITSVNECQEESYKKDLSTLLFNSILKLYEYIQESTVSKLNDSHVGLIVNANNNKDVGLMYAKETAIEVQKARQKLSLSELPLLDDN